jgi:ribonucleoside-diphosphate reductase alpha chain
MVCLDLDHPDVMQFIRWKVVEEQKVAALVAGSRLGKRRLQAVIQATRTGDRIQADRSRTRDCGRPCARRARPSCPRLHPEDLHLAASGVTRSSSRVRHRLGQRGLPHRLRPELQQLDPRPQQLLRRARQGRQLGAQAPPGRPDLQDHSRADIWNEIAYAAWACADPGCSTTPPSTEWHTLPEDGRINASNPCSEYMFLDDTACNLASINLVKFLRPDGGFDVEGFRHACRLWTMVLEISVLMAAYPSPVIAQKSWDFAPSASATPTWERC